jgi:hypothetical protein
MVEHVVRLVIYLGRVGLLVTDTDPLTSTWTLLAQLADLLGNTMENENGSKRLTHRKSTTTVGRCPPLVSREKLQ